MNINKLQRSSFDSNVEVKWCRGCGDFTVLKTLKSVLADLNMLPEETVFISGIGCSSRLPYYINTFGFHTIHGRAPAVATGVKMAKPELNVWVITGDGDALSIGGNHFIHAIRRNQDIKVLLFNNAIYGLTKGQTSPTSKIQFVTNSTPYGSADRPINPLALAASAQATFLARTVDNDPKHLKEVLVAAAQHKGTAIVEILQNCPIFNDKVHEPYYGVKQRARHLLYLNDQQPLTFGAESEFCLITTPSGLQQADAGHPKMVHHRVNTSDTQYAFSLSQLSHPEFPVPVGIFRQFAQETQEQKIKAIAHTAKIRSDIQSVEQLLYQQPLYQPA